MKPFHLLIAAALVAGPAAGQDMAARAAIIEKLQTAGTSIGSLPACTLAGYQVAPDQIEALVAKVVADAQAAGMFAEIARNYVQVGQKGRGNKLFGQLTDLRHMAETGDKAYPQAARKFADAVIASCDDVATDPDAHSLFAYSPASNEVARSNMLRSLGEPAPKRR